MAKNIIQDMGVEYFLQHFIGMLTLIDGTYYKVLGIKNLKTDIDYTSHHAWTQNQSRSTTVSSPSYENSEFFNSDRWDTPEHVLYLFRSPLSAAEGAPFENFKIQKNGFIIPRPTNIANLELLININDDSRNSWMGEEPDKYHIHTDDEGDEFESDEITDEWYDWQQEGDYYNDCKKYYNAFSEMVDTGLVTNESVYPVTPPVVPVEEPASADELDKKGLSVLVKALTNKTKAPKELHEDLFISLACFPRFKHQAANVQGLNSTVYYNTTTRGVKVCNSMETFPLDMLNPVYPENFIQVIKQLQGTVKGPFNERKEVIMKDGTVVRHHIVRLETGKVAVEYKLISKGREIARVAPNGTIRSATKEVARYINEINSRLGDNL